MKYKKLCMFPGFCVYGFVTVCAHLPKAYRLLLLGLECRGDLLLPVEEGSRVVMLSPRNASPSGLACRLQDCGRRSR